MDPGQTDQRRSAASCTHNATKNLPANAAQQLKTLKTDFDSLRSHLTCKICDRMLYQPYTIACGHTYCYTVSMPILYSIIRRLTPRSVSALGLPATRATRHVPIVALS
jgi:hypothetical protein